MKSKQTTPLRSRNVPSGAQPPSYQKHIYNDAKCKNLKPFLTFKLREMNSPQEIRGKWERAATFYVPTSRRSQDPRANPSPTSAALARADCLQARRKSQGFLRARMKIVVSQRMRIQAWRRASSMIQTSSRCAKNWVLRIRMMTSN